ncbi:MAG: DUF202 domain-containing protein [Myxococcales bacterium]|nr:DUF202 domain-containing protein [Myxococcales bacterium]
MSQSPDLRLLQANERTFLAWIRTGLALVTFGFVISRLGSWLVPGVAAPPEPRYRLLTGAALGGAFVVVGVAVNGLALARYVSARRALFRGEDGDTHAWMPLAFGALVTLLGLLIGLFVVWGF